MVYDVKMVGVKGYLRGDVSRGEERGGAWGYQKVKKKLYYSFYLQVRIK